jgi:hypothetical protein
MPDVGARVYAVGNPEGLTGTFSEGIVSAIRPLGPDTLLQLTAAISPGSSGGPVLDERGRVLGVATATLKNGQSLNFAVPAMYVARALKSAGPAQPLSAAPKQDQARWASEFGRRSTEGVVGTQFVWKSAVLVDVITAWNGEYSFSLRNTLSAPVENVQSVVIFKDEDGQVIDAAFPEPIALIPAGLAQRAVGKVAGEVQGLTTPGGSRTPRRGRVEIRVLDFRIAQ